MCWLMGFIFPYSFFSHRLQEGGWGERYVLLFSETKFAPVGCVSRMAVCCSTPIVYFCAVWRADNLSESEGEMDGPHNQVVLPQDVRGRGNIKAAQSAIRSVVNCMAIIFFCALSIGRNHILTDTLPRDSIFICCRVHVGTLTVADLANWVWFRHPSLENWNCVTRSRERRSKAVLWPVLSSGVLPLIGQLS